MAPVWTYPISSFEPIRKIDARIIELGDGYYVTGMKSQAWSHQDGTGGSDTSYRGYHKWNLTFPVFKFGTDFTNPLDFLQARWDAGFQTFRVWDPIVEPDTTKWLDGTGPGMHLVKHLEDEIRWDSDTYQLVRLAQITVSEVHS